MSDAIETDDLYDALDQAAIALLAIAGKEDDEPTDAETGERVPPPSIADRVKAFSEVWKYAEARHKRTPKGTGTVAPFKLLKNKAEGIR